MNEPERTGIIDIGSNSIRLVIYEQTEEHAYRVIDESKESARLSERINTDGILPIGELSDVVDTLLHFKMMCEVNQTKRIRAVATAAIRNAGNSNQIVNYIQKKTGMNIEVLSGAEEARFGFLGMINSIDVQDGFLIDIGGGSTEVTLFRSREVLHSISIPFGSLNTAARFARKGAPSAQELLSVQRLVEQAISQHSWISENPNLPLIGLGGTLRCLCKLDQKAKKYSLPLTHNYAMQPMDVEAIYSTLLALPPDQLKKVEGMSKDRVDLIVPGLAILTAIFPITNGSHYIISGSGLRDGLYMESLHPESPKIDDVLEHSVRNLMALHPSIPAEHVNQVYRIASALFKDLQDLHGLGGRVHQYILTSSLLYRIGVTVNYYEYNKHTYYLMAHSRINGLTHREILLCAMIASYKNKNRTRQMFLHHRDVLSEDDFNLIIQIGVLLRLAISMDRSETQPIAGLLCKISKKELLLQLFCKHSASIELREVSALAKDFQKIWGLHLRVVTSDKLPRF